MGFDFLEQTVKNEELIMSRGENLHVVASRRRIPLAPRSLARYHGPIGQLHAGVAYITNARLPSLHTWLLIKECGMFNFEPRTLQIRRRRSLTILWN